MLNDLSIHSYSFDFDKTKDPILWDRIAFLDDILLIPSSKGIGILDLTGLNTVSRNFLSETQIEKRFYYCAPDSSVGDSISNLIPISSTKEVVIVPSSPGRDSFSVVSKKQLLSANRSTYDHDSFTVEAVSSRDESFTVESVGSRDKWIFRIARRFSRIFRRCF